MKDKLRVRKENGKQGRHEAKDGEKDNEMDQEEEDKGLEEENAKEKRRIKRRNIRMVELTEKQMDIHKSRMERMKKEIKENNRITGWRGRANKTMEVKEDNKRKP